MSTPTSAQTGPRAGVLSLALTILLLVLVAAGAAVIAFGSALSIEKAVAAAAAFGAVPYVALKAIQESREYQEVWSTTTKDGLRLAVIGLEFAAAVLLAVAAFNA